MSKKIPRITDDSGEDKNANQITGDGENVSARWKTPSKYFRFSTKQQNNNRKPNKNKNQNNKFHGQWQNRSTCAREGRSECMISKIDLKKSHKRKPENRISSSGVGRCETKRRACMHIVVVPTQQSLPSNSVLFDYSKTTKEDGARVKNIFWIGNVYISRGRSGTWNFAAVDLPCFRLFYYLYHIIF